MNEKQLEEYIRSFGKDILRFCRITTGNREDGEELYQDTMLILLEKQKTLDAQQDVKSYALSIALKLWKNRKKKRLRRLRLVPQESLEALAEQGIHPASQAQDAPEAVVLREDLVRSVRLLVEELPDKYRLPLQLYYAADLPVKSVAKVLKLPENTVKSRLLRGKEILRRRLEAMEDDRSGI